MNGRTLIGLVVAAAAAVTVAAGQILWPTAAAAAPVCDPLLNQRTPEQVLADYRAALAVGDWAAVRCNLDDDAVMISDSGVKNGEDEIVGELQSLSQFFAGTTPTTYAAIVVPILGGNRSMVRTLYFIDTTCVDIPDGTETFIIKGGEIAAIATHGSFVFSC